MGDESVVSGLSTEDAGGPALGGPQQGGAEGVIKKLSNFWFIIGSIPLVLFLLVCLPTMFYVQSISSYVNAFYCRSKACDNLAEVTKAARDSSPCVNYHDAVCKASTKYSMKGVYQKDATFIAKVTATLGDNADPRFTSISSIDSVCKSVFAENADTTVPPVLTYLTGDPNPQPPERYLPQYLTIYKNAQMIGIDCVFRLELVHSSVKSIFGDNPRPEIGEKLPTDNTFYDLAVSVPDMGLMDPALYIVKLEGKKYEDAFAAMVKMLSDQPDPAILATIQGAAKYYELTEIAKDKDYTTPPSIVPLHEFGKEAVGTIDFKQLLTSVYPGLGRVLVRSPTYVRYLALNIKPGSVPTDNEPFTVDSFKHFVILDAFWKLGAFSMTPPAAAEIRSTWCLRWFDWMRPVIFNSAFDAYLKTTYWPFALANPKDPKKPFLSSDLGMRYTTQLMDSFLQSYSLSEASSEKSRAGLYLKMLQMDKVVFYVNSSVDTIDKAYADFVNPVVPGEGDFAKLIENRKKFFEAYWKLTPTPIDRKYLIARHPMMYGDDEGSYDYGSNTMYVPFGMFRPTFYRDSTVYMGNYAVFGYWGSMNILKMLDNAGAHSKVGYQHPVLWTGTYAYGKMAWQYRCLNPEAKNGSDARMVAKGSNPLTPGYRFFRKMALARAHPRPEYRLDADAEATMEQIYLTAVAQTYCRYKKLDTTINQMFQHDLYFQKSYCAKGGKLKVDPNKACYIWRSTRRNY